jgi:hypothetical protein
MGYSVMLFAQSAPTSSPAAYGSIRGTVLESDNKPLAGATVFVLPAQDMRHQLRAQTDANGKYIVTGVPSGEAYVHAFDEDKGYPYNFFSFFLMPGQKTMKVLVSAQKETADVNLKLGEKAARLQLEIVDDSGAPITDTAELVFTRPDLPGYYRLATGDSASLLVPPVKFHLSINVPGFKQWNYENKETNGMLQPKSEEIIKITAHLARAAQ